MNLLVTLTRIEWISPSGPYSINNSFRTVLSHIILQVQIGHHCQKHGGYIALAIMLLGTSPTSRK